MAIASASNGPIQIGRCRSPATSLRITTRCCVTRLTRMLSTTVSIMVPYLPRARGHAPGPSPRMHRHATIIARDVLHRFYYRRPTNATAARLSSLERIRRLGEHLHLARGPVGDPRLPDDPIHRHLAKDARVAAVVAVVAQHDDVARLHHHRLLEQTAPERRGLEIRLFKPLAIDEDRAVPDHHLVSRQADDPFDERFGSPQRRVEHDDIAPLRRAEQVPLAGALHLDPRD